MYFIYCQCWWQCRVRDCWAPVCPPVLVKGCCYLSVLKQIQNEKWGIALCRKASYGNCLFQLLSRWPISVRHENIESDELKISPTQKHTFQMLVWIWHMCLWLTLGGFAFVAGRVSLMLEWSLGCMWGRQTHRMLWSIEDIVISLFSPRGRHHIDNCKVSLSLFNSPSVVFHKWRFYSLHSQRILPNPCGISLIPYVLIIRALVFLIKAHLCSGVYW